MMNLTTTNSRREAVLAASVAHRASEARIAREIAKRTPPCQRCDGRKRLVVFLMEGPGNPTVPCPDCTSPEAQA